MQKMSMDLQPCIMVPINNQFNLEEQRITNCMSVQHAEMEAMMLRDYYWIVVYKLTLKTLALARLLRNTQP